MTPCSWLAVCASLSFVLKTALKKIPERGASEFVLDAIIWWKHEKQTVTSREKGYGNIHYLDLLFKEVFFRAKIWTVPLSLETHRYAESWLKLMLSREHSFLLIFYVQDKIHDCITDHIWEITNQYRVAGSAPRRNSTSKFLVCESNTRISVPCKKRKKKKKKKY